VLTGTPGNDVITGAEGNDIMDGASGNDLFLVSGRRHGKDHIIGGEGFDTISGGNGDDTIGLTGLFIEDGIERIDGGPGRNAIVATGGNNILHFGATELLNIASIEGRNGRDVITGSNGDDVIYGGEGNDTLSGGAGDDSYMFALGDGRDVINNADDNPDSVDILQLIDINRSQIRLWQQNQHLFVDIDGATDRVIVKNWFANESAQLDAIYAADQVILRDQVDQLVNAMAAFDAPTGVGVTFSEPVRQEPETLLASAWKLAA
jgi:Ca2+-binding RTX toxin-like protein